MNDLRRRLARLEQRAEGERRYITLRLAYAGYEEPIDWDSIPLYGGVAYVVALPNKAPSTAAWYEAVQARFAHELPGAPR